MRDNAWMTSECDIMKRKYDRMQCKHAVNEIVNPA